MKKFELPWRRGTGDGFPRGSRWLGVKLGQTAVKIAVLRRDGDRIVLEDFGFLEVPPPGVERREASVRDAIQELTANVDRRNLRVSLVMDGGNVDVNFVQVPSRIPEKEFHQVALLQAASVTSIDLETARWDALRQGQGDGETSPTLVAVSSRESVDDLGRILAEAGLGLDVVTVAPLALGALALRTGDNRNVAVMDIGARSSAVGVFQGERLLYARDTRVGSDPITDEIAEFFDGDRALAESLKRNWVLPGPGEEPQPIMIGDEPYFLDPEGIESVRQMREELLRSIRYIQERVGLDISKLILTGGGSRLGGLVPYLGLADAIDTGVADALAVVDEIADGVNRPLLESVSHRLAQAIGAAYLGVHPLPARQLNLLRRHAVRQEARGSRRMAQPGMVKAAVYTVLVTSGLALLAHSAENYELRRYQTLLDARAVEEADQPESVPTAWDWRRDRREPWAASLRTLASTLPDGIRLERIETARVEAGEEQEIRSRFIDPELEVLFRSPEEGGSTQPLILRLQGRARNRDDLVTLLDALDKEPIFARVRLEWTRRPDAESEETGERYMGFSVLVLVTEGELPPEVRS